MVDTIATQEQTTVGPSLSLLSEEELAKIRAQAEAEVEAREAMELRKTQVHQMKMQGRSDRRRQRKAEGLARREDDRLNEIRLMWPKLDASQRVKTIERFNYKSPTMIALFHELQAGDLDAEEIPTSVPSLVIVSEAELKAELARREQHATDAQTPDSPSVPATPQTPEEQDESNALEDTEPRKRTSRRLAKVGA